jgi:beta-lactam-binding protein with PASTA domain
VKRRLRVPAAVGSRRLYRHFVLALVGFVAAWIVVAFAVFPTRGSTDAVAVPAVLGLPYDEAAKRLSAVGLDASLGETRLSGEAPRSTVLSQVPAAGSRVPPGMTVTLDVSAGQQRATIPKLAGRNRADAEAALREAKLQLGQVTERQGDQAGGTVLSSQPAAGQVVPVGTAVDLVVSSGPAALTMPDLVGRDLSEVRGVIEQLGLTIGEVTYDSTSSFGTGRVLQQNPAAGAATPPGAPVNLRVAAKP